jgi:hypothetical protein
MVANELQHQAHLVQMEREFQARGESGAAQQEALKARLSAAEVGLAVADELIDTVTELRSVASEAHARAQEMAELLDAANGEINSLKRRL